MESNIAKLIFDLVLRKKDFQGDLSSVEDDVESSGNRMGGRMAGAVGTIGKAVAGIAVAAGVAGVAVGGMGLSAAAANETAAIGFETMLGSADKAKAFMGELASFAAKTPFELPGLRDAASRFLAVGVEADRVIPIMTVLGDATSAVGTGSEGIDRAVTALGQMQQKGKVTGEEMLQLVEAGVPAWDALASKLGVDVATAQDMVSKNQVKVNDLFSALEERAGPALQRVSGMMDKQSASLSGMVSTLKDTVTQGLATAMAPAVDVLKASLGPLTGTIQEALNQLGPALAVALEGLAPAVGSILPMFSALVTALAPVLGVVGQVAGALAQALEPVLLAMAPIVGQLAMSLGQLLLAFVPLIPPLGELLVALLPLLPPVVDLATVIANVLVWALTALGPILPAIVAGLGALAIVGPIAGMVSGLGTAFVMVLGLAGAVMAAISPLTLVLFGVGAAAFLLWQHWDTVWNFISGLTAAVVGFLQRNFLDIISFIFPVIGVARLLLDNWSEIWGGIQSAVSTAVGWVGGLIGEMVGLIQSIPGRIVGAIGNLGGLLIDAGRAIIQGLIDGIKNMVGAAVDAVKGAVGSVISGAKKLLGIGSPSRVFMAIGSDSMAGLALGLEGGTPGVESVLGNVTDLMTAAASPSLPTAVPGGRAASVGGGGVTINVTVHVAGSVTAKEDLALEVRDELLRVRGRYSGLFPSAA